MLVHQRVFRMDSDGIGTSWCLAIGRKMALPRCRIHTDDHCSGRSSAPVIDHDVICIASMQSTIHSLIIFNPFIHSCIDLLNLVISSFILSFIHSSMNPFMHSYIYTLLSSICCFNNHLTKGPPFAQTLLPSAGVTSGAAFARVWEAQRVPWRWSEIGQIPWENGQTIGISRGFYGDFQIC